MKVGVYGMGRFGSFWASLLAKNHKVIGYNRSKTEYPLGVQQGSYEELCSCHAIFLCVSISSFEDVIKELATHISENTLIFDTCSVKRYPVELMERYLPKGTSIIATHPMFGPDSGKHGVEGLPMILSNVRSSNECYNQWKSMFTSWGVHIVEMTPDEHDKEAAYTQGITHFVGRVLDAIGLQSSHIGTKGYEKLLEIIEQTCNDPEQLFKDLQRYNPHTREMRIDLARSIEQVMGDLEGE